MAIVCPGDQGRMAIDQTVTVNGASNVVINNPKITPNSMFDFTLKTPIGTVGAIPRVVTIAQGTATIQATASDLSIYNVKITG